MAVIKLTESDLQSIIHKRYEKNTSVPDDGSDDNLVRRSLMNDAVDKWGNFANAENIKWRELYTTLDDAATGDKTATTNVNDYNAPDDFIDISSYVYIEASSGTVIYKYKKNDEVLNEEQVNPSGNWFYITGSPSTGYTIHINAPVAGTIHYGYYKSPTKYTSSTSVCEIRKPYFVVYEVLSALFEEERPDLSNKYLQMAADLLNSMKTDNEIPPDLHEFPITSVSNKVNGVTWGRK